MATKKKAPANPKKKPPELVFEEGYWWIVQGTKRVNMGRNERYARDYLAKLDA